MSTYWLGVRDARLGHAETHPIRPFTSAELASYRQGYSDQKITNAMASRYFEHREPCECPACQAGAYCIREIERVAGNCGE